MISHESFFKIAKTIGENSKCGRKKVGALIVKDNRIISTGYNGLASGSDDSICSPKCTGCEVTIHAEMNAILFAAKNGVKLEGSTMYCNYSPCLNCAKHILNSGIKVLLFNKRYEKPEGLRALRLLDKYIEVYQIDDKGEYIDWEVKGIENHHRSPSGPTAEEVRKIMDSQPLIVEDSKLNLVDDLVRQAQEKAPVKLYLDGKLIAEDNMNNLTKRVKLEMERPFIW